MLPDFRKCTALFEGFQASPAGPAQKGRVPSDTKAIGSLKTAKLFASRNLRQSPFKREALSLVPDKRN